MQIQSAFLALAVSRPDPKTITVSDICKKAGINRTTFYSHYFDVSDLLDSVYEWMMQEFLEVFRDEASTLTHSFDFNKLFINIKENQIFYKLYFKLGFDFKEVFWKNDPSSLAKLYYRDTEDIDYHVLFFSAGVTAIIQKWLSEGCPGEPEHMSRILVDEYQKNNQFQR